MTFGVLGMTAALALLAAHGVVEQTEFTFAQPAEEDEEPSQEGLEPPIEDEPELPPVEDEDGAEDPEPGADDDDGTAPDDEDDEVVDGDDADFSSDLIEEESLPTVEDLAFPRLEGDFDGDDLLDTAEARESDMGVQIALELSTTGETYVEPLGTGSLRSVEWRVVGPEELLTICDNPIDCPTTDGIGEIRDVIFVTINRRDSFILHWNGDALETYFVDY